MDLHLCPDFFPVLHATRILCRRSPPVNTLRLNSCVAAIFHSICLFTALAAFLHSHVLEGTFLSTAVALFPVSHQIESVVDTFTDCFLNFRLTHTSTFLKSDLLPICGQSVVSRIRQPSSQSTPCHVCRRVCECATTLVLIRSDTHVPTPTSDHIHTNQGFQWFSTLPLYWSHCD